MNLVDDPEAGRTNYLAKLRQEANGNHQLFLSVVSPPIGHPSRYNEGSRESHRIRERVCAGAQPFPNDTDGQVFRSCDTRLIDRHDHVRLVGGRFGHG